MVEVLPDRLSTPLPIGERKAVDHLADLSTDGRSCGYLKTRQANEKRAFRRLRLKSRNGRVYGPSS